ncbi:hypothetical protein SORBI_3006G227700 [Sorghum bicolor]|uniref:Uncharacterized protein n=1 Tax=Sorghum bicolor TaxID=4558 RepID=A0A1B6PNE0_SORBI|nr:hypothetical protein SORBI_3006G227700 [Sorghum bicolor]
MVQIGSYPSLEASLQFPMPTTTNAIPTLLLAGLKAKALPSLMLRASMVASVDVTFFLKGIEISMSAFLYPWHVLVLSVIALPSHLVFCLTTLLPFGSCICWVAWTLISSLNLLVHL